MNTTIKSTKWNTAFFDVVLPLLLLLFACVIAWAYPQLLAQEGARGPAAAVARTSKSYANDLTYVLIAAIFLPLVLRKRYPLVVLGIATVLSAAYSASSNPPTMTAIAPVMALYLVGRVRDRRTTWIAFAAATLFTLAVTAHTFTDASWIGDIISTTAIFAVAASLGDATRSRRAYIASIEQRAVDAERTREEEARRRVEEERLRIARELHDVTAHSLSIIALHAGAAEKAVKRDPDAAIAALRTIRATSKESLDELRAMLGVLRSADEDAPLSPAGRLERLPDLVRTVEQAGVHVTLEVAEDLGDVPAYVDVSAYRIVQEAITNVVRHAQAPTARVVVAREGDELTLEIADDGRGATAGASEEGHGIAGMRERVAALSGTFSAGPVAGGGFKVAARLPLKRGTQRRDG